jgi:hypothetical protein
VAAAESAEHSRRLNTLKKLESLPEAQALKDCV